MAQDKEEISRVIRSKKDARISYDRMSRLYDFLAGPWGKKFRRRVWKILGLWKAKSFLRLKEFLWDDSFWWADWHFAETIR